MCVRTTGIWRAANCLHTHPPFLCSHLPDCLFTASGWEIRMANAHLFTHFSIHALLCSHLPGCLFTASVWAQLGYRRPSIHTPLYSCVCVCDLFLFFHTPLCTLLCSHLPGCLFTACVLARGQLAVGEQLFVHNTSVPISLHTLLRSQTVHIQRGHEHIRTGN